MTKCEIANPRNDGKLQVGRSRRIAKKESIQVDVRVIAATNRNKETSTLGNNQNVGSKGDVQWRKNKTTRQMWPRPPKSSGPLGVAKKSPFNCLDCSMLTKSSSAKSERWHAVLRMKGDRSHD